MPKPLPPHPNVRKCTHIKVTGQQCGSPALRGEFFCYFHTRVIKGVQQRVDMQLHSMALLEDCEAIQLSIMHVVDGLLKGTLDPTRARLIIQALRIAARNAKNVRFDDCYYEENEQKMVREVPDYARQYLIEHPEFGPPLSACGAGAPAREAGTNPSRCGADTPVREAEPTAAAQSQPQAAPAIQREAPTPAVALQHASTASPTAKNAAHGASPGSTIENDPAPKQRKNPDRETQEEQNELKRVQAAVAGAERGNWRDLRTVFEFAGISAQNKDAPS
jgi:hypothetical protein